VSDSWEGIAEADVESTEKDKTGSSSGSTSHEAKVESGEGELGGSISSLVKGGGRASLLFFEEDVLNVSCPGSSEADGDGGGRNKCPDSVTGEDLMEQPHATHRRRR
jgi:hypothetical protein